MKRKILLVFLFLLLTASFVQAQAEADECDAVYLFDAWARASIEGAPTSAVYGLLVNLGHEQDTLLGASTESAEVVELHEMVMGENDVMQMRPVEGGMVIAPDAYLELKPGGLHIMLINLTEPLVAGESLDLTLHFEQAGDVALSVPIREVTEMDMAMPEATAAPMSGGMTMHAMGESAHPWDEACAKLYVVGAWARPANAAMPTSAVYLLLLNLTESDELLVSASSDAAEAVELHEMLMGENDVMQMRPVEGGIPIPAGGAAQLKPGGLHLMLINLTGELATGDTIEVTLIFAESGDMTLEVPVKAPEEDAAPMSGM